MSRRDEDKRIQAREKLIQAGATDEDVKTGSQTAIQELIESCGDRQAVNALLTNKVFLKFLDYMDEKESQFYGQLKGYSSPDQTNIIRGSLMMFDLLREVIQTMKK